MGQDVRFSNEVGMPIYEYVCGACGHELEVLQKISDAPLRKCPECGKSSLRKLISAPSFRLKGGGWYETDFKSGNQRNLADGGAKEDKPAAKDKDTKPVKESPAKPEAAKAEKKADKKTKTKPSKAAD
jgi:putative FmdB family regulatory protein